MGNLIFKGIQQVFASGFTADNATNGVLYFVRNAATGDADIYFGKKHYGSLNATQIKGLQESINKNAGDITAIKALLGDFTEQFKGDIQTVAQVTKANADAISVLNGDGEGSVAKAVEDAKTDLEGKIQEVADSVESKNVSAEGDIYVSAIAEENKVTVSATEKTIASLALADSALQKADIIEGTTNGTINVEGTDVAVHGLGTAAYTDSSAYDKSGAAAAVKTELVNGASDGYNTLKGLETKIKDVAAAAKSYEIKAITTGLSANVKEAFGLFDEDGVQTGATINIYKDSSLKEVKLSGQSLQFTYILANGTESTVGVDVSTFLSEAEFKNGLQVVDGEVSVKKDASSEKFLSVSADGIKLSGVQDAIDAGVTSANSYSDNARNTLDAAITGLTKSFKDYTGSTEPVLSGLRTDVNTVSAATITNANAITGETKARKDAFDALSSAVDTKVDKTTYEADKARTDSVLESIKNDLTAITSSAVTSIVSTGKTITVVGDKGAVNVEVNTLAHAESGQDGYVIFNKTNDGALYGVMYYGGDDAE